MIGRKVAVIGIAAIVLSLCPAAPESGCRCACAQAPTNDSHDAFRSELLGRLTETERRLKFAEEQLNRNQSELDALRERDAQWQTWQQSVITRLPSIESNVSWASDSFVGDSGGGGCDVCPDGCQPVCPGVPSLCDCCMESLSWNKGPVRIVPFGYATAEMIAGQNAYTLLGAPLFLLPAVPAGIPDSRFTVSGQQTTLGFNITGPDFGAFRSSANVVFNFFGNRPVQNNPGVFFLMGYLELRNEDWRFWAGQDPDSLGRQSSNSPAWTAHRQSGNFGQIRPGFRAERFFQLSDTAQTSIYFGLTQQVVLDFIAVPTVAGTDNGWPNVELRWEVALGSDNDGQRPVMFAVGGLVGETRAVDFAGAALANVSTTWAVIPEARIQVGNWGVQGEAFVGDAIGTYNAGIGQSLNPVTGDAIYTAGGFGEIFWNVTPSFTAAIGYGIDNPRDGDLGIIAPGTPAATGQRSRNEAYWINAIWKLSDQWETRFEVSRQKTDYIAPSTDSSAMIYHLLVRYNF